MKKDLTSVFYVLLLVWVGAGCSRQNNTVKSPDGDLSVQLLLQDGQPYYSVSHGGEVVLEPSDLGLFMNETDLSENVELTSVSGINEISESHEKMHGKQRLIDYQANERVFTLSHQDGSEYEVIFRVSNDGVAFRYHIPGEGGELSYIHEEFTTFNLPDDARAWLQPLANVNTGWSETNPSYEEDYYIDVEMGTVARDSAGWAFPALFKTGANWLILSETGLDGTYPGTRLNQFSPNGNFRIDFPQQGEQYPGRALYPESELPWKTPWRIIAIGDLETVTESTLGSDLADPQAVADTDWIRPGRAAWSWAKLKDESVNYDVQKQFIDYAAEMGWEYILVDVNWDQTIGYDRMQELVDYASGKEVGLLLWYNSSGDWNTTEYTPKSKLLTHEDRVAEFSRIHEMGIKGIKVDFFGGDGQSMVQYYLDLFKDAADYELLVNTHGTTLPRGWHRTWPNLMTMESVKGFEFITFDQRNTDQEPEHSTILPFTRNVFSPMDFTPMSPTEIPGRDRVTTPVFEIALPVLFTSGIQHYAETADGMKEIPVFVQDFIKEIPVVWDEMEFIDGYPGKEVIIARRAGDEWFVAGVNGEGSSKEIELDLSFIPEGLTGTMIYDGSEAEPFAQKLVSGDERAITLEMKPNGGFVILFK